MKLFLLAFVTLAAAAPMDVGTGGVYDSPFANDIYVRQFGWLFGGGRSGIYGLKAMQDSVDMFKTQRVLSSPAVSVSNDVAQTKRMVELTPITMESKQFNRFMAVP